MNTQNWRVDDTGYRVWRFEDRQAIRVFEVNPEEPREIARRIVAAVKATKDFTTAGLEEIAAGGYEARLALLASLMLQEIETRNKNAEQDDAEAFRGTRGD
jgi:hypothetical protein